MKNEKIKDILGWDIINWGRVLSFLENNLPKQKHDLTALELGSGFNGGLSLWLALKGIKVICSGYNKNYVGVSDEAKKAHVKYEVDTLINYEEINAAKIPYRSKFDIICYKSVLGGIVRNGEIDIAKSISNEIFLALKPGGMVLFLENVTASCLHKVLREKVGSGKNDWHYFTRNELQEIYGIFHSFDYKTYGFTGCFGINEYQRILLGKLDGLIFENTIPKKWNYILAGVAMKKISPSESAS